MPWCLKKVPEMGDVVMVLEEARVRPRSGKDGQTGVVIRVGEIVAGKPVVKIRLTRAALREIYGPTTDFFRHTVAVWRD